MELFVPLFSKTCNMGKMSLIENVFRDIDGALAPTGHKLACIAQRVDRCN